MTESMRGAPLRLGVALCLLPALALASEPDSLSFPRPAEMRAAIHFWKLVFGRYGTQHALVHDSEDLRLVYGVEPLPPTSTFRQRQLAQEVILGRYRQAILRLAEGPGDTTQLSDVERRVRRVLGATLDPQQCRLRAEALRLQVGQRDRILSGLNEWDRHGGEIKRVLGRHGVPEGLAVLPFIESAYNPRARSKVGASGLWQIMPRTGKPYLRINRNVDERLDPLKATAAAAKILYGNYVVLGSWPLAITAYNHGAGGVARGARVVGSTDIVELTRQYRGPAFGFASRNFYAEFVAVLELMEDREAYFGPQSALADIGPFEPPMPAAAPPPPVPPAPAAEVSVFEDLVRRLLDLSRQVTAFTTVDARALPVDHVTAIRSVFDVAVGDTLRSFRWGPSLAPNGDARQGTLWCTIWHGNDTGQVVQTYYMDPRGQIVDRVLKQ
ncbi:MAG: lytic transglycosylase domain-containing protein [Gemmatimonadota bacterium]